MKRSALKRRAPLKSKGVSLKRSEPLRRSAPLARVSARLKRQRRLHVPTAAEVAWAAAAVAGKCGVCGQPGILEGHHVLLRQKIRDPDYEWDPANRIDLVRGCGCHAGHHHPGVKDTRIRLQRVPDHAIDFTARMIGPGPAYEYLRRRYADADSDPRLDRLLQPMEV